MLKFDPTGVTISRTQMFLYLWYILLMMIPILHDANVTNISAFFSFSILNNIFKVDSSDRKRMSESTGEFNELLKDEKLKSVPIIVLANKQDLSSSMKASEVAELIGLVKLKDRDWQIQACSALEGTGLQEAMDWICKCVKK